MSIVPLYGHHVLRDRLAHAADRGTLPASLLLHGPAGVGKQRLALWLGQRLLCTGGGERPCGGCQHCRYASDLVHPDLHWFFPRPRLDDTDADSATVLADYREAIGARARRQGIYERPPGSDGIHMSTVRTIVQLAAIRPAMGSRKIFVVGDAERMVPQEGSEYAANAFLKMLEEPLPHTTIIITSSEPGALLPTIRSRVISLRVSPLSDAEIRAFAVDHAVIEEIEEVPPARLAGAGGVPGALIGWKAREEAAEAARAFLDAALAGRRERMRGTLRLGGSRARGFFSAMLDALTEMLHAQVRQATERGDEHRAFGAARAIAAVEEAKIRASGNVNPQLIGAAVARELAESLR